MTLKDLKIGTQLRLGLGVILLFVVALGVLAWIETERLWLQIESLYEHPFTVVSNIGEFEADILCMHRGMKDLTLVGNDQETTAVLQDIETHKARAAQHLGILYDAYLGPRADIAALQDEFAKWNVIREETIRLLRAGKTAEVVARTKSNGVGGAQAEVLIGRIQRVEAFAKNKADEFYAEATALNDAIQWQLAVFAAVILLLSLGVAWLLSQGIKTPLAELTEATGRFRQGQLDVRSQYAAANEFGTLCVSFNAMAEAIQTQMEINESAAQLAGVMLREDEAHAFCRELLKELLEHTGSQVGAAYFLNAAKTAFEHFESIGLGAGARAAFSAAGLEGELGAAVASRQIQHITDIPADTRFAFAAVSGEFQPREILTIPVLSDHEVSAVISLASVHAYDATSVRLVNDLWSLLTARVNGVLAFRKVKDLAETLEHQNRELDAQKQELATQAAELTEQNTELEMQKRQLGEANRLKSAFLSNMSHELRTPLNSVIALSGVLNRRLAHTIPAEEYGYLEVIERNGKNLLALINDILDLSRIEAGRADVRVSRFSVRDLVGEIVAMLEPQALEKGLVLLNQVPADLPPLASDLDKCRHILQNLVGNAVKFTEQGQVTITAEALVPPTDSQNLKSEISRSGLRISVTDTGIGIPADALAFIFDEFRQADDGTSRKYGGSGLGLAIARKYALLLGGEIAVESVPGRGSTFTCRLPLELAWSDEVSPAASALPLQVSASGPVPALSGQGRSILLIEDNEPAIIQLTDILRTQGYRLLVARNGREALAQIEQTVPDALILDLMMPHVDGFQVLQAIRGAERTAHLPVLILTAKHVTKEELSFLKGNHIQQLIQKGDINKAGLLAAVARMVAPPPVQPASPPARRRRPARPGKPLVLVVEDNPDSLRTAKVLLADRYEVIAATDGRAGVEQARVHQPDVILMDISLPVMDGIDALREIRQDETLRHIPVLALTASAMKGDRETILAHGFDGYLAKPIDHDTLMTTIREVLD